MARFEGGWILVARNLMTGDLAHRGPDTIFIWMRLLTMANWRESTAVFKGTQRKIQPGQLLTGLEEIGSGKVASTSVRRTLEYLDKSDRIRQEVGNQGRLITICNWAEYQSTECDGGKQTVNGRQTGGNPAANERQLNKQGNNVTREQLHPAQVQEARLKRASEVDDIEALLHQAFDSTVPPRLKSKSTQAKILLKFGSPTDFEAYLNSVLAEPKAQQDERITYVENRIWTQIRDVGA